MSKYVLGAIAAAATCVTVSAQAADMYGQRPYAQPYTVNQPIANTNVFNPGIFFFTTMGLCSCLNASSFDNNENMFQSAMDPVNF